MSEDTKIQWTDHTWNPWYGCTKVSAGCDNCYMYRDMTRYGRDPEICQRAKPATFNGPLRWKAGRVFTCSWSDFFITDADPWRDDAWNIIRRTPHLTYQILTKRPALIERRLPKDWGDGWPNVWLGVSAENQAMADARIPILLRTPAAVRFVSAEPLLAPIDLRNIPCSQDTSMNVLQRASVFAPHIDWVIVGGESGTKNHVRTCDVSWIREIVADCKTAGVAVFVKQLGSDPYFTFSDLERGGSPLFDAHGGDPSEWPEDLRVREYPTEHAPVMQFGSSAGRAG